MKVQPAFCVLVATCLAFSAAPFAFSQPSSSVSPGEVSHSDPAAQDEMESQDAEVTEKDGLPQIKQVIDRTEEKKPFDSIPEPDVSLLIGLAGVVMLVMRRG